MGKEKTIKVLLTDEERLLVSRATELSVRCENKAVASSFLTPREQRIVFESLDIRARGRLFMWGGYVGSVRRRAVFLPEWMAEGEISDQPLFSEEREKAFLCLLESFGMLSELSEHVCTLKLTGSGYEELSHRDWLGALMALGIKRNVLGDILVHSSEALLFCEPVCGAYISSELKSAGRDRVYAELTETDLDLSSEQKFESISTTIAAPRLDGVVKALCSISREQAQRAVSGGLCEINYYPEKEPDARLLPGDILSVRGYGKFVIDSASDETRRGRIKLLARKYL